jgi:tRNA (mo5U34)-methyltransferase
LQLGTNFFKQVAPSPFERIKDSENVLWKTKNTLSTAGEAALRELLEFFKPWKKGPFTIAGTAIDSEWRSDLKWERVLNLSGVNFAGKKVADIGCNNGYFMLRLLDLYPEFVVGFEPVLKSVLCFDMFTRFDTDAIRPLVLEPLGVEHVDLYEDFFDVILCMGIIYHQTDPIQMLRKCRSALAAKGELILESHSFSSSDSLSLTIVPEGRYAGASGVWWVPSEKCLLSWLKRAGFSSAKIFYSKSLQIEEQRTTPWAPIKSLRDFLNPEDLTLTIEGYPAPMRTYIVAKK